MNVQNLDIFAGEDRTLTLYARDEYNNPLDLTNWAIDWRVGKPPFRPWQKGATFETVGVVTDALKGQFTVNVGPGDTYRWGGNYLHMALGTNSGFIQFVNNAGGLITFTNNQGGPITWTTGTGDVAVLTSGQLRVRAAIQGG